MKRIKFIIILLMFIPCFIFAESYDKAHSIIENYMNTVTYKNTYKLFLYDNKSDFIDYDEYLITNKKGNSYLFDGTKFWTKTKKDNKYYVVSLNEELVEKENTTISAKDSEYVLPNTYVSGSGTIDNPWIFKQGYKVSISSNTYGKISLSGENKDLTNKLNLNMINTSEKLIYVYPNIGYEYISNTCEAVYTGNYLTFKNINMNKICEIVFGVKSYKITLDNTNNDVNKSTPEVIYSVENIGYFSNESATTLINKITPPKRTGYIFNGYSKEGTIFIDSTGKVLQEKNNLFDADGTGKIEETPITYKISYNKNDSEATGTMSDSVHTYDTSKALNTNTFSKQYYNFIKWNTDANGLGLSYGNEEQVKNLSSTNNDTIVLYAQWEANEYYVEYNGNGASSGSTSKSTHLYGKYSNLTKNGFYKTGYTFSGWKDAYGNTYNDEQEVGFLTSIKGKTIILYAQWTPNKYEITFDYNYSGGGSSKQTVTYDSTYGTLPTLNRNGYYFIGWFDINGNAIYDSSKSYNQNPLLYYADYYADLYDAFHYDQNSLYSHYINNGKNEGRRIAPYISSDIVKLTDNITLYAGWLQKMCLYYTGHDTSGARGNADNLLNNVIKPNFKTIMGTNTIAWDDKYGIVKYIDWGKNNVGYHVKSQGQTLTSEQMERLYKVFRDRHYGGGSPYINWLAIQCGIDSVIVVDNSGWGRTSIYN